MVVSHADNLHPFSVSDVAHDRTHEDSLLSQRDNGSHWLVSDAGNNSNFFSLSTPSKGMPGGSGFVNTDRHRGSDDNLSSQRDNSSHWLVSDAGNNSNFLPSSMPSSRIPRSRLSNTESTNTSSCNDDSMTFSIHSSNRVRNDGDSTLAVSHSTSSMNGSQPVPYVINLVSDDNSNFATAGELDRYSVRSPVTSSPADIANLQEIFPDKSLSLLKFVFELCSCSFSQAAEFLTSVTFFALMRSLAAEYLITTPLHESPRIHLDADDEEEDYMTAALAFYKCNKFDKNAAVRITIHGQPGVDTGGIRRQFFSVVFTQLIKPLATSLFEGALCRLRPAYKATSLSSDNYVLWVQWLPIASS